jgi:ABC-type nitrate/sulfonate/bicarbonate transport system substrate-binding protein
MNRATSLSLIGSAVALACPPRYAAAQNGPATVRVGATPIDSLAPVAYAMRTGMFEKVGLRIELSMMGSGNAITAAVVGGALDIGLSSLVAIIQGHLRGIPLTIVAPGGLWVDSDTAGLVVARSSPLRKAADFNNKTISTNALASLDTVAMQAWVDQNGGDSKTLHFFELPAAAAQAALLQGRVDASLLSNPQYAAAIASGARSVAHPYDAIGKQFSLGVWTAMQAYVDKNRTIAERFSRVVADAGAFARAHPEATVDDEAAYTKQDPSVIAHMTRQRMGTTVSASDIQPVIDTSAKYKFIEKAFPASELISPAAAR